MVVISRGKSRVSVPRPSAASRRRPVERSTGSKLKPPNGVHKIKMARAQSGICYASFKDTSSNNRHASDAANSAPLSGCSAKATIKAKATATVKESVRKDTSIRKFASNKSKLFKKIDGSNAIEINRTSSNVVQSKASTCRVSLPQGGKHKSKCSIVNDDDDDDRCSVASAILEEDICFKCGMSSLNEPSWSDLILCDICDGEFHLACAGLETAPRSGWRCQRCNQEYFFFRKLKYEVLPYFKAPRSSPILSVCYSPSKPLEVAWIECQSKGFMVVQSVFPLELLRGLTHGRIEGLTKSGRLVGTWNGALEEIKSKIKLSCENLTDRTGRFDLKLPSYVVESLCLEDRLKPILLRLRSVMGQREPFVRTHNVVFVPCGSDAQPWHYDDSVRLLSHRRYFTILISLNPIDENCGGTEIWDDYSNKTDLIRPRPGDAFVFHGGLRHRGCGNSGKTHRLFYYASFSCGTDDNVAT